jgi:hypothetical protein
MDDDELMEAKNELQKNEDDEGDVPVERAGPMVAVSEAGDFQLLVGGASGLDVGVGVCVMLVIEVLECLLGKLDVRPCFENGWEHQHEVEQVE